MKEYHFSEIDSTSIYLKNNYTNEKNLTFVSADFQFKGHGRYNRVWISKKGEDLLFSVLIKDKSIINRYASLSLASAVCVYELLLELNVVNVSIKWPNDVYVNDKKISGILLEGISNGNDIEAIVIGIGLNVNSSEFEIPATSIFLETKDKKNLNNIKKVLYSKIINMLKKLKNDDNSYLQVVKENNYLKNKTAYLKQNDKEILIEIIGIDEDNCLLIKKDDKLGKISSGEIVLKKPYQ